MEGEKVGKRKKRGMASERGGEGNGRGGGREGVRVERKRVKIK